ncbi:MAG: AI-2E family transporter [Acidobacteriota bacterium]|nr:AI-2E family transporter [Acidobacteriota bacterium]
MPEENQSDKLEVKQTTESAAPGQLLPKEELVKTETIVETKQGEIPAVFTQFTMSTWLVVRVVLVTLLLIYIADFLKGTISLLVHLFFLMILSVSFAYLIQPLVNLINGLFERVSGGKTMPRPVAIALSYLIVFSVLGIGIAAIAPLVTEQGKELSAKLPDYTTKIQERFGSASSGYRYRLPQELQDNITKKLSDIGGLIGDTVGTFLIDLVTYLPWLLLIPILSFFFLKDVNLFRISLLRLLPHGDWRTRVEAILEDFNKTLSAYARAQLTSCFLIGLLCTVGFYLIGLNYAVLLGILAGIFEFVPLIGPLTIAVIVILTASVSDNPWEALYAAIFLVVLRIAQDYVIYPRIVREGIHLHPLAIILSVLAGEQIAGIAGVFIAIPLVALLTVLYKHILEHSGSTGVFADWLAPKENPVEESGGSSEFEVVGGELKKIP